MFPESQALIDKGAVSIYDADCIEALAEEPDCPECGLPRRALVLRDTSRQKHAFALCDGCGHEEEF